MHLFRTNLIQYILNKENYTKVNLLQYYAYALCNTTRDISIRFIFYVILYVIDISFLFKNNSLKNITFEWYIGILSQNFKTICIG